MKRLIVLCLIFTFSGCSSMRKNVVKNNKKVKIAIIDSGINPLSSLTPFLGKGYSYIKNESAFKDYINHGTPVSSFLILNLEKGIPIQIDSYKVFDSNFKTSDKILSGAINRAIKNKSDIINISSSGIYFYPLEFEALKKARDKGIIIVVSSGNMGKDNDQLSSYPCNYELENIVCVGSTNNRSEISKYSNIGKNVDIYTLGEQIIALNNMNQYEYLDGTSYSTAKITAILSSLINIFPDKDYQFIINKMKKQAKKVDNYLVY